VLQLSPMTVVAGVIERAGKILICQRKPQGRHPLKWEFPGGKVEPGEDTRAALRRELREELGIEAEIGLEMHHYQVRYGNEPPFDLVFYRVDSYRGALRNLDFARIVWEKPRDLARYDFLEGDIAFVNGLSSKPMTYFLAKTDPETYSIDDLEREKKTVWDGVTNPQAVRAIREMQPGDRVFVYHSGGVSGVVGMAVVRSPARADPKNPKSAVVDLEFAGRIDPPVTLKEIKETGEFGDWALVRQGRLSTMAAPEKFVHWMRKRYPGV
jgi:mutator protein MutT